MHILDLSASDMFHSSGQTEDGDHDNLRRYNLLVTWIKRYSFDFARNVRDLQTLVQSAEGTNRASMQPSEALKTRLQGKLSIYSQNPLVAEGTFNVH